MATIRAIMVSIMVAFSAFVQAPGLGQVIPAQASSLSSVGHPAGVTSDDDDEDNDNDDNDNDNDDESGGGTRCIGTLPGPLEDVVVPEGESCTINATKVSGKVTVSSNARLTVQASDVGGDIVGDNGVEIKISATDVNGRVSVKSNAGLDIDASRIRGDVSGDDDVRTRIYASSVDGRASFRSNAILSVDNTNPA